MLRSSLIIFIGCFLLIGCKSIAIHQDQQKRTKHGVILGSIGKDRNFVLQRDYVPTTFLQFHKPIKLEARIAFFNKTTFKAFEKSKLSQSDKVSIAYYDSLEIKPKFINLRIVDRIALLKSIKSSKNKDAKEHIRNSDDAHLITNLSIALKKKDFDAIRKADEVFLINSGINNYVLTLFKEKKQTATISFKDGVIFSYKTSNFCWKQDDKYQLQIIDLVESSGQCPKKSYRSAKRADKKINYFNF